MKLKFPNFFFWSLDEGKTPKMNGRNKDGKYGYTCCSPSKSESIVWMSSCLVCVLRFSKRSRAARVSWSSEALELRPFLPVSSALLKKLVTLSMAVGLYTISRGPADNFKPGEIAMNKHTLYTMQKPFRQRRTRTNKSSHVKHFYDSLIKTSG